MLDDVVLIANNEDYFQRLFDKFSLVFILLGTSRTAKFI